MVDDFMSTTSDYFQKYVDAERDKCSREIATWSKAMWQQGFCTPTKSHKTMMHVKKEVKISKMVVAEATMVDDKASKYTIKCTNKREREMHAELTKKQQEKKRKHDEYVRRRDRQQDKELLSTRPL